MPGRFCPSWPALHDHRHAPTANHLPLISTSWGYVAFDNKRFAMKAMAGVAERPFVIGFGCRPVRVALARNEVSAAQGP